MKSGLEYLGSTFAIVVAVGYMKAAGWLDFEWILNYPIEPVSHVKLFNNNLI